VSRLFEVTQSAFPEIFSLRLEDRGGEREVSVRVLQYLGTTPGYLTPAKIRDLWKEYSKHDVLFSDQTRGDVETFVLALMDPKAVWFEFFDITNAKNIGVASLTDIIPLYDAYGHFAFWDGIARGREDLIWELMSVCFEEFGLHRISVEIPVYQKGAIRMIGRLGFKEEGERREVVLYNGKWVNTKLFGLTVAELEEVYSERHAIRKGSIGDSP